MLGLLLTCWPVRLKNSSRATKHNVMIEKCWKVNKSLAFHLHLQTLAGFLWLTSQFTVRNHNCYLFKLFDPQNEYRWLFSIGYCYLRQCLNVYEKIYLIKRPMITWPQPHSSIIHDSDCIFGIENSLARNHRSFKSKPIWKAAIQINESQFASEKALFI